MTEKALKDILSKFGSAIKHQRQLVGISQEELAYRSGLHRTYVTDIERGARNVTLRSMTKIASALNVTLIELLTSTEQSESEDQKLTIQRAGKKHFTNPLAINILLIEDNPKHAELTVQALAKYSLANQVINVQSGEEALNFLFEKGSRVYPDFFSAPQLILLDLILPGISGVEVLKEIRAHGNTRSIPIIVLTASRSDADLRECMKLGVSGYITKPIDFAEFSAIVPQLGFRWLLTL